MRPAVWWCSNIMPHPSHEHFDGPDTYHYWCPGKPGDEEATE